MSFVHLRLVRRLEAPATQKALLYPLADMANDSGECWPSVETLVRASGLSERAVQTTINRLVGRNLVIVERTSGRTNRYRLTLPGTECAVSPAGGAPPHELHLRTSCNTPPHVVHPPPHQLHRPPHEVRPEAPSIPKKDLTEALGAPLRRKPAKRPTVKLKDFEKFYSLYPRKVARGAAEKAFTKAVEAAGGSGDDIINGLKLAIALGRFNLDDGGRYCPYPATWLNRCQWLDGEAPTPPAASPIPHLLQGIDQ